MWWISRASPVSTTMLVCSRVPSATRCWCTAPSASIAGIGTRSGPSARSETTIRLARPVIAALASRAIRSSAASRPWRPSASGQVASRVVARSEGCEGLAIRSSSSLFSTGWLSTSWIACSGPSESMLPSEPIRDSRLITIDSRTESIGGLVTWAKRCLK